MVVFVVIILVCLYSLICLCSSTLLCSLQYIIFDVVVAVIAFVVVVESETTHC